MGRLVSNTSMTVDGLCDVGAWFVAAGDHDTAGVDQLAAAAGFVTGRKCYEGFLGYWPSATGPWAEVLNPMPKYIASRALTGDHGWVETIHPARNRPRRFGDRVSEPHPKLTGAGHRQIDQGKHLRSNNTARAAACRQAILLWLYNDGRGAAGTDQFIPAGTYQFYGAPFTEDEVSNAVIYLLDRGLIQGIKKSGPALALPVLTTDGIECIEHHDGDVRARPSSPLCRTPQSPSTRTSTRQSPDRSHRGRPSFRRSTRSPC
jgi:hypothetical protein